MAFDVNTSASTADFSAISIPAKRERKAFFLAKRGVDILGSLVLLTMMLPITAVLLILNPFMNRGPLFFAQERMGKDCVPFTAFKFRSMVPATVSRGADCPLEVDRITPLGRFLRKSRLDEFPQAINVLKGEMSLIGPRPDYIAHANHFLAEIPGYRERHVIRPGISGLAQTEVGYVEGTEATRAKVRADLDYIRNLGFAQEVWLIWRSVVTIVTQRGS